MESVKPPIAGGYLNNQFIRMYAASFKELLSLVTSDPSRNLERATVDQIQKDLSDAQEHLPDIPLPHWEDNYFRDFSDGIGHSYKRKEVAAFVARVISRLEALSSHGDIMRVASSASESLRLAISRVSSPSVSKFATEALDCLEAGSLRAAVVLSWVGAVAVLHDYIARLKLAEFNAVAAARDPKWRAQHAEDLERMREFDFLQILESISVIDKAMKHDLEACLKLRNACGHPTMLEVSQAKVAAHIETLVLNVFMRFV